MVVNPAITIDKSFDGAADTQTIAAGGTATFTITVTNTGDIDLVDVEVVDPLAPLCDNVIGLLAVGGTTTYTCTLAGVPADFENVADVTGLGDGLDPADPASTVDDTDPTDVVVVGPAISIDKSFDGAADTQTIVAGGTAAFTITVTNTGDIDLVDVEVVDPLAPLCDNVIGPLAVGDAVTYTCTLAGVPADFENVADVTGVGDGLDPADPASTVDDTDPTDVVVVNPAISIDKLSLIHI